MSDFHVLIHLASPLFERAAGGKNPIMLDGLLARIRLEQLGVRKTPAELVPENLVFADLPIERVGKCYLCSAAFYPDERYVKPAIYSKRGVGVQSAGAVLKELPFAPHAAQSKPGLMLHNELAVEHVDFYIRVPDERVQEFGGLLANVKNYGLGTKTGIGFGQVAKIEVERNTENPDLCFRTADGLPTRPLPVELFQGKIDGQKAIRGMSTYYAPYWFAKNKTECYLPSPRQFASLPKLRKGFLSDAEASVKSEIKKRKAWLSKKKAAKA